MISLATSELNRPVSPSQPRSPLERTGALAHACGFDLALSRMTSVWRRALILLVAGNWIIPLVTAQASPSAELLSKENVVDAASGGGGWKPASVGQTLAVGDKVKTGEGSREGVRMK